MNLYMHSYIYICVCISYTHTHTNTYTHTHTHTHTHTQRRKGTQWRPASASGARAPPGPAFSMKWDLIGLLIKSNSTLIGFLIKCDHLHLLLERGLPRGRGRLARRLFPEQVAHLFRMSIVSTIMVLVSAVMVFISTIIVLVSTIIVIVSTITLQVITISLLGPARAATRSGTGRTPVSRSY